MLFISKCEKAKKLYNIKNMSFLSLKLGFHDGIVWYNVF